MTKDNEIVIYQTTKWIKEIVVGLNFCPFAGRELLRNSVHYQVVRGSVEKVAEAIVLEFIRLDENPLIETTLLILPEPPFDSFDFFLSVIEVTEDILVKMDYEGVYQLAHFHPDYQFQDTTIDDPTNYTNRSPYPILHILRAESMEKALENYPNPDEIPKRNIEVARKIGIAEWRRLLGGFV